MRPRPFIRESKGSTGSAVSSRSLRHVDETARSTQRPECGKAEGEHRHAQGFDDFAREFVGTFFSRKSRHAETDRRLPTISAPNAIALATSRPPAIPPLATIVSTGATSRARRKHSAVGIPHPANAAATRARQGCAIRCRSTSLHDVPPAPATSIAATPASNNARTASGPTPQPTSFTTTGKSTAAQSAAILSSRPRKHVSPSA